LTAGCAHPHRFQAFPLRAVVARWTVQLRATRPIVSTSLGLLLSKLQHRAACHGVASRMVAVKSDLCMSSSTATRRKFSSKFLESPGTGPIPRCDRKSLGRSLDSMSCRYTLPAAKDKLQLLPESKLMIALGAFKRQLVRSVKSSEPTPSASNAGGHMPVGHF
jgi:hypothetical protein